MLIECPDTNDNYVSVPGGLNNRENSSVTLLDNFRCNSIWTSRRTPASCRQQTVCGCSSSRLRGSRSNSRLGSSQKDVLAWWHSYYRRLAGWCHHHLRTRYQLLTCTKNCLRCWSARQNEPLTSDQQCARGAGRPRGRRQRRSWECLRWRSDGLAGCDGSD